jgi:hypothetical protein
MNLGEFCYLTWVSSVTIIGINDVYTTHNKPEAGFVSYAISMNLLPGTLQIGHLSGTPPSTVFPHTGQTWIVFSSRSFSSSADARALE